MAKYRNRKKLVVIEAWRVGSDEPMPVWLNESEDACALNDGDWEIATLEGDMKAQVGDYIIKGVKGELYPCKSDIFKATYEKAEG